jgi:hypothetical protein
VELRGGRGLATLSAHWVLQGNPARWDDPDQLYVPITRWCVTGIQRRIAAGDEVLVWMAHRDPRRRGVHAVATVTSDPHVEPDAKPWVDLAVSAYVVHDPVSVLELRESPFASHPILRMARRTAYPCTPAEHEAARALVEQHGPTAEPLRPRSR